MRVRVRTSQFTPSDENTGEAIAPTTVRAATNQKIANAIADVLYGLKGLSIEEDMLEFSFGRGDNVEVYQVEKPDDTDLEIDLNLGPQEGVEGMESDGDEQYTELEKHELLRLMDHVVNDAQRILAEGVPVPSSLTNNAGSVGVTLKLRKLYPVE